MVEELIPVNDALLDGEILDLSDIVLDEMKKDKIIMNFPGQYKDVKKTVHYRVHHLRKLMTDIYKLYSKGKTNKSDFLKVIAKNQKSMDRAIMNFSQKIESMDEPQPMKVLDKKKLKDGTVILKLKPVDQSKKAPYVKRISEKLAKVMSMEQIKAMFEQMIKKLNDVDTLKKVDKALEKKKPKIKSHRGCFELVIECEKGEEVDLFLIG